MSATFIGDETDEKKNKWIFENMTIEFVDEIKTSTKQKRKSKK